MLQDVELGVLGRCVLVMVGRSLGHAFARVGMAELTHRDQDYEVRKRLWAAALAKAKLSRQDKVPLAIELGVAPA